MIFQRIYKTDKKWKVEETLEEMQNVIFLTGLWIADFCSFSGFGKRDDRSRHLRRGLGNLPDQQRE